MTLTTCLWFDGKAREAAEFYVSIFPDSHVENQWTAPTETPSNEIGSEVFVNFKIFGASFMGLNGGPHFTFNESVSFQIPCANQSEIDRYWSILSADGGEPGRCGWLKDKFGVSWQVVSPAMGQYLGGENPEGARAATEALMKMDKIDLDVLRRAYEGAAPLTPDAE